MVVASSRQDYVRFARSNLGVQELRICGSVAFPACGRAERGPISHDREKEKGEGEMRIAQVAPLTEAVPPRLYGGTERVVHWLTEELVTLGHDVTLFASGDSQTSAKLDATWPKALRLDGAVRDPNALHMVMLERVRQKCDEDEFDFEIGRASCRERV